MIKYIKMSVLLLCMLSLAACNVKTECVSLFDESACATLLYLDSGETLTFSAVCPYSLCGLEMFSHIVGNFLISVRDGDGKEKIRAEHSCMQPRSWTGVFFNEQGAGAYTVTVTARSDCVFKKNNDTPGSYFLCGTETKGAVLVRIIMKA